MPGVTDVTFYLVCKNLSISIFEMKKPHIVIAPALAAGGILVTALNGNQLQYDTGNTHSGVGTFGNVHSFEHNWLKVPNHRGTIEEKYKKCVPGRWYQTHVHDINLDLFDLVINITTESLESRYYIFLRTHYHDGTNETWVYDNNLDNIDPVRIMAKEYALPEICTPINDARVRNIELCDMLHHRCRSESMHQWRQRNAYIYQPHPWMRARFNEAVWEVENNDSWDYGDLVLSQ